MTTPPKLASLRPFDLAQGMLRGEYSESESMQLEDIDED